MLNFGKVLVVAAHPDDEVLGCGGLVAKLTNEGQKVRIVFIAEGSSCRFDKPWPAKVEDEIEHRKLCGIEAMKKLKVSEYHFYNLPCGRLDEVPIIQIAKIVENEINNFEPETILTHSRNDVHNDHKLVFQATLQATRPVGKIVTNLLSFEILSSSEWNYSKPFKPNLFVDITETFIQKISAMRCYTTEQPEFPHPRSDKVIQSLASFRGSQSGVEFAESFEVVRLFS